MTIITKIETDDSDSGVVEVTVKAKDDQGGGDPVTATVELDIDPSNDYTYKSHTKDAFLVSSNKIKLEFKWKEAWSANTWYYYSVTLNCSAGDEATAKAIVETIDSLGNKQSQSAVPVTLTCS